MTDHPIILIIIPVYNEKTTIRSVVTELIANPNNRVIIVDDGSTEDIFTELHNLHVYYIRHRMNLGQGAALQTGFDFARQIACDVIITFDADGQHDHRDLPALITPVLRNEADIVFGSRFIDAGRTHIPRTRKYILKLARLVNFLFTGVLLSDAHNGLRAFHPKLLHILRLTENRMAHATEILYLVKKHKLSYCEAAVQIRYTAYSKHKGQGDWNSVRIFSDLVLHKIFRSSSK